MFFGMALLFGFWGAWAVIRNEDIKVHQNLGKSTHAKICKPLFELTAYRFVLFCFSSIDTGGIKRYFKQYCLEI